MADDDRALEISCISVCSLCATHIRSCDSEVLDIELLEVWKEYCACIEVVTREIEESLDLVCVEVACHHAVTASSCKHVSNELCTDRNSWLVFAVLACPAEVRHNSDYSVSRSSLGCVNHEEKLEKVVCWREC